MRPYAMIHPAWGLMMMVGWNLYLIAMTPRVFHPYIDVMQRKALQGLHTEV